MTAPAAGETTGRPVALFVLGMGRSGTSALTRVLSLCGAALPVKLVGANAGNPRGFWEPRAALWLNDAILFQYGSSRYDPSLRLQGEGTLDAEDRAACIGEIEVFVKALPEAPLVVIKELAVTALSDLWFDATSRAGFDIAAVIAVRHPQEVIASLAALERASPELTSALWLKYNLLAERNTRAVPRVFLDYTNLLRDWRREINRIAAALPINLEPQNDTSIDEFLHPDLRRHRHPGPVIEPFGTTWMSSVYDVLYAAARDEPWDDSHLDRIFESYRACEHGFRTAFEDFRNNFSGVLDQPIPRKVVREF